MRNFRHCSALHCLSPAAMSQWPALATLYSLHFMLAILYTLHFMLLAALYSLHFTLAPISVCTLLCRQHFTVCTVCCWQHFSACTLCWQHFTLLATLYSPLSSQILGGSSLLSDFLPVYNWFNAVSFQTPLSSQIPTRLPLLQYLISTVVSSIISSENPPSPASQHLGRHFDPKG